jgi:hypothetical protein
VRIFAHANPEPANDNHIEIPGSRANGARPGMTTFNKD